MNELTKGEIEQIKEILNNAPDNGFDSNSKIMRSLYETILAQHEEIERLKEERESNYEKWQAKYQQLKDGLTLVPCYECSTPVHELSPRSRCCMCEYGRANFNERENAQLRER